MLLAVVGLWKFTLPFLALCMVWGRQERGTGDYLWENLAFITSPKVAQTAPLMKSCSWFKRAIVSLTFVLTKNIPPILLSYCSHFGFLWLCSLAALISLRFIHFPCIDD